jgi:hypothetical protein
MTKERRGARKERRGARKERRGTTNTTKESRGTTKESRGTTEEGRGMTKERRCVFRRAIERCCKREVLQRFGNGRVSAPQALAFDDGGGEVQGDWVILCL